MCPIISNNIVVKFLLLSFIDKINRLKGLSPAMNLCIMDQCMLQETRVTGNTVQINGQYYGYMNACYREHGSN